MENDKFTFVVVKSTDLVNSRRRYAECRKKKEYRGCSTIIFSFLFKPMIFCFVDLSLPGSSRRFLNSLKTWFGLYPHLNVMR